VKPVDEETIKAHRKIEQKMKEEAKRRHERWKKRGKINTKKERK